MKEFRKDINGLRCIAVLAVLFYHFDLPGFTSGYIGVDVFFVISGYLMTDIILTRLEQNRFSLIDFWLSRARRIIPALYILLIAVIAYGWFWLPPHAYKTLARFAVASMLFISNIIFKNEAGNYFGEPAHENWLLHTWSLSVEWQFYVIYPLVLIAVYKTFKSSRAVHATLLLWLLVSLGLCILKTPIKQSSAFFFLSMRTWEFLVGAFVYIVLQRFQLGANINRILESTGLLIIITSVAIFKEETLWPGYLAMIPVLGTACVIAAGDRKSLWSNNILVEHIGKWSYSIYLWHWPIIVGLGYFEYLANTLVVGGALLSSIVIGGFSYHWVENPIRAIKWRRVKGISYALVAVLSVVIAGAIIMKNKGVPGRVPEAVALIDQEIEKESIGDCKTQTAHDLRECIFGNKANITVAVWGDSHARAAMPGIVKAAELHGQGVVYYNMPACPPIFGVNHINIDREPECNRFNEKVFSRLQERRDVSILLISRFSHHVENKKDEDGNLTYFGDQVPGTLEERRKIFQHHLIKSICTIATNRKVYVLKPVPEMEGNVPKNILRSLKLNDSIDEIFTTLDSYNMNNSLVLSALETAKNSCGIILLDPVPYLCNNNKCYGVMDGHPMYKDSHHLSDYGSQILLPMFVKIFN